MMFNKGSLSAQRLLTATKMSYPNYVENLSRALWTRVWSKVIFNALLCSNILLCHEPCLCPGFRYNKSGKFEGGMVV